MSAYRRLALVPNALASRRLSAAPRLALALTCVLGCGDGTTEDGGPRAGERDSELPRGDDAGVTDAGANCTMQLEHVPNEGSAHVSEGSALDFAHNPPASGSHYPSWTRFEAFDPEIVPRGYWVHNLEHGGIVLLFGPDADAPSVTQLRELYDAVPRDPACDHKRVLLTADPELPSHFAAIAWDYVLQGDCIDAEAVLRFVDEHRGRAPENVCSHGSFVP